MTIRVGVAMETGAISHQPMLGVPNTQNLGNLLGVALLAVCACVDDGKPASPSDFGAADAGDGGYTEPPLREVTPAPVPDLRFKWVGADAFEFRTTLTTNAGGGIGGALEYNGSVSMTPLELWLEPRSRDMPMSAPDSGDDKNYARGSWFFAIFEVTPSLGPLNAISSSGYMHYFERDLVKPFAKTHRLVSSFDIAIAASEDHDTFGVIGIGRADQEQIFTKCVIDRKPRAELESALQQEASEGRVTTALAGDGSLITFFSYDWIGDTKHYEVKLLEADYENLDERARTLADEGYIITAFGRDLEVLLLVGTREEGTSEPRTIELLQEWELPRVLPGAIVAHVSNNEGVRKSIVQR